jgi:hypothetical protein
MLVRLALLSDHAPNRQATLFKAWKEVVDVALGRRPEEPDPLTGLTQQLIARALPVASELPNSACSVVVMRSVESELRIVRSGL